MAHIASWAEEMVREVLSQWLPQVANSIQRVFPLPKGAAPHSSVISPFIVGFHSTLACRLRPEKSSLDLSDEALQVTAHFTGLLNPHNS